MTTVAAAEQGDRARHRVLVVADDVTRLLGVEPCSQRRGANEVREHHRQLAPLGCGRPYRRCGIAWGALFCLRSQSRFRQNGNRFEELATMPDDGDANVFEIVSSQLGQNPGINLVVPECLLVALQPQLLQPSRDVHGIPHGVGHCRKRYQSGGSEATNSFAATTL